MAMPLTEEVGEGCLYLSGDGQGLDALQNDALVKANSPKGKRCGFDTSYLSRYENTDFLQWYGRRSDGRFHPYGKILRLTKAGIASLASEPRS